jgi:hypothetical protein
MVLVGIGMLTPALAAADTFNFSFTNNGSGTDISNLSIDTVHNDVSFEMATSPLTAQLKTLATDGTLISSIFINDFQASTLVQTDEFDHDLITSVNIVSLGGDLGTAADVTFTYETTEVLTPSATPEPSSLVLLGTGLLTGLGALRRKLRL